MKKFATRCIAGLCAAAGSLVVSLPAQAAINSSIRCEKSGTTNNEFPTEPIFNLSYVACSGPREGALPKEGMLNNLQSILDQIAFEFSRNSLERVMFQGTSANPNGPFQNNPMSMNGILSFDMPVFGKFVLGFAGQANTNYSYYLFDAGLVGTTGVSSVRFDTKGIASSDGLREGPNLEFAALFMQPQALPVPEPGSIGLIAAAFGALVLTVRRRRG